jgi:TolB-like protein/Tfp pilus assembly protein PilF
LTESGNGSGQSAWERLRSRKLVQWGAGYIAASWGLLQATEFAVSTFHWPEVVTRAATVAAVCGLPIALTLAWFHGEQGNQRFRRAEIVLLALLALTGAIAVRYEALTLVPGSAADAASGAAPAAGVPATLRARSVAVLPFQSIGKTEDGEVLGFGIAEAVLHQLANLRELEVTARTSSFSLQDKPGDAREVGRMLNARYLLEGSVQQSGERLRVTAQLIDAATGAQVWSIRFDKVRADIFAMQDEIAAQVAKAMQLSLDADAATRLAGQGTTNVSAYLAYLQGRSRLATASVSEAGKSIDDFSAALQLDPAFPAAYVSLAEAEIFIAEFDATEDRAARFEAAGRRAWGLVAKALELDPGFGPAYLMRGYLEAFSDLDKAEASYRRGLQLRASDAKGYAGLASVLFEQPAKRAAALDALEQARRLDPLEPAHDVTKSVFLLYDRGDVRGADALLRNVLQRLPDYQPAITRLGGLDWCCEAKLAEAIQYLERALALDPQAHYPRRVLVRAYLQLGDEQAASAVIASTTQARDVLAISLHAHRGDWERAGELAYAAVARELVTPLDEDVAVSAIRNHAHTRRDYARAIDTLQAISGVAWTADDKPVLSVRPSLRTAATGLADMLLAAGETARADRLLGAIIERMQAEMNAPDRSELWYYNTMATALALSGDKEGALAWLQRGVAARKFVNPDTVWRDPAFASLRSDPRYAALERKVQEYSRAERAQLDALRAAGEVPQRR